MTNNEIFFASSKSSESRRLRELVKQRKLRKIAPRIYTSNLSDLPENIIRRNAFQIAGKFYPEAVLSHRSAFEYRPSPLHVLHLTVGQRNVVRLPGLTLILHEGPAAKEDDRSLFNDIRVSSPARAFLENLEPSRSTALGTKGLTQNELEAQLERICREKGDMALNEIRERARKLSTQHPKWKPGFEELKKMISALLGTGNVDTLKSELARARASGTPYDAFCVSRLEGLFSDLQNTEIIGIPERFGSPKHRRHKDFFDAYFSNYIEGTEFEIEEAESIVFDKLIPEKRSEDAHDILGTYRIVSDLSEMRRVPDKNSDQFLELLKSRHAILLAAHPDKAPGRFKDKANRAGSTHFVDPHLVEGTLRRGFDVYKSLEPGFRRAIFMMFLVAEVHPFLDGNGRTARIMMNAELESQGLSTIIIPTVYREDYLLSLRALSRRGRSQSYIEMLLKAHRFSSAIDFSDYRKSLEEITRKNWFLEPTEGKIII